MPEITLIEFAEIINKDVQVTYVQHRKLWVAYFNGAIRRETRNTTASSIIGEGDSPEAALADYVKLIKGQTLVFMPVKSNLTCTVPETLVYQR